MIAEIAQTPRSQMRSAPHLDCLPLIAVWQNQSSRASLNAFAVRLGFLPALGFLGLVDRNGGDLDLDRFRAGVFGGRLFRVRHIPITDLFRKGIECLLASLDEIFALHSFSQAATTV
jgi:hypothetical protein